MVGRCISYWDTLHIPPWEKENHLHNAIYGGYVSSQEGSPFYVGHSLVFVGVAVGFTLVSCFTTERLIFPIFAGLKMKMVVWVWGYLLKWATISVLGIEAPLCSCIYIYIYLHHLYNYYKLFNIINHFLPSDFFDHPKWRPPKSPLKGSRIKHLKRSQTEEPKSTSYHVIEK